MRLGYAMLLAVSFATPAIAQQIIIQGSQPGQAGQAARGAGMERREARQDLSAARREEMEASRALNRGNLGAAITEERQAQRDLSESRREQSEARKDLNRAQRDEDWTIRVRP